MSGPFFLAAATEDDLASLLSLERESYTHPWTPKHFRDALAGAGALCFVLRAPSPAGDGEASIVAYCIAQIVVDELHVHNLLVRPTERARGVGRRLLRILLEVAAGRGARLALLEVRQSNWPALQLYRSLGFEAVAVRRDYYERPREDAVLLQKADLAGPP